MNRSSYKHLTNACLAIVVTSALLFEKFPSVQVMLGLVALGACVVSFVAYVYTVRNRGGACHAEPPVSEASSLVKQESESVNEIERDPSPSPTDSARLTVPGIKLDKLVYQYLFAEVRRERTLADEVVDVVRALAPETKEGTDVEFEMRPDGRFFVRLSSGKLEEKKDLTALRGREQMRNVVPISRKVQ